MIMPEQEALMRATPSANPRNGLIDVEASVKKGEVEAGSHQRPLDLTVVPKESKYPFCLVWTPIPGLTTLIPFIGHMGIADSKGMIYDFAGPYFIHTHELAFGRTSRYIQVIGKKEATVGFAKEWDAAIAHYNQVYSQRMHNLCWDNCHSHCKNILNKISYANFHHWNMAILAVWMFLQGKFVRFWYSFLPTIVLYGLIGAFFVLV